MTWIVLAIHYFIRAFVQFICSYSTLPLYAIVARVSSKILLLLCLIFIIYWIWTKKIVSFMANKSLCCLNIWCKLFRWEAISRAPYLMNKCKKGLFLGQRRRKRKFRKRNLARPHYHQQDFLLINKNQSLWIDKNFNDVSLGCFNSD